MALYSALWLLCSLAMEVKLLIFLAPSTVHGRVLHGKASLLSPGGVCKMGMGKGGISVLFHGGALLTPLLGP